MKKIVALILVVLLAAVAFVGCQANDKPATPATDSQTTNTPEPDDSATTAEEVVYTVGCVFPYSAIATTAELLELGIEGYLAYWEENGQWADGKNIKIVPEYADNEGTAEGTMAAGERLAPVVDAFIGCYGSGTTVALVPIAERNQKPMLISLSVTESVVANPTEFVFRPTSGNSDGYKFFHDHLWPTLDSMTEGGIKTYAVIKGSSEFASGAFELHSGIVEDVCGAECVFVETLQDGQTSDVSGVIRKMVDANPDVVLSIVAVNEAVLIQNTMREQGVTIPVYATGSGYMDNGFYASIPSGGADGVVSQTSFVADVCNYVSDPDQAWTWYNKMKEMGGIEPNEATAATWLCMGILIDALNRAESLSGPDVAKAIAETELPTDHPANMYTFYQGGVKFEDTEGLVEGVTTRYNQNIYAGCVIAQRWDDDWKLAIIGDLVTDSLKWPVPSYVNK